MQISVKNFLLALGQTTLVVLASEIIIASFFPAIGIENFRPHVSSLIIFYLSFKFCGPMLPLIIVFLKTLDHAFTKWIWAVGPIAAIIVTIIVGQLKEVIHMKKVLMSMAVIFVLQYIMFFIEAAIIFVRYNHLDFLLERFKYFIPESIFLTLISPVFFKFLDTIWPGQESSNEVAF